MATYEETFKLYVETLAGGDVNQTLTTFAEDAVFHDEVPTLSNLPALHIIGKDNIGAALSQFGSRKFEVEIKTIRDNEMLFDLVAGPGHKFPCKGILYMSDGLVKLYLIIPNESNIEIL
ncbi:hypothetical protein AGMMS49983_15170 [Clostridia bacterium]|nr:hypothetical protein AGMMS49983_15170 [Clostridia bacterium]